MEQSSSSWTHHAPMLLEVVRDHIRAKHYSRRTEQSYTHWIHRYVLFHGNRHPRDMGAAEVEAFLTDLAVNGKVSAATQTQALSALLFLYRNVLAIELPWLDSLVRAKPSKRIPVVLSVTEAHRLLDAMEPRLYALMARLIYGTGMRLMECVRLRVKDLDFDRHEITVRMGKGGKDRMVPLPDSLMAPLKGHLADPHRPGTPRSRRCFDHHDLHARTQSRRARGGEPAGSAIGTPRASVREFVKHRFPA